MNIEERLENLEIKITYMEDFLKQIQKVAVGQSKEIDKLKAENRLMIQKIKELIEETGEEIPNRKPPHY